MDNTVLGINDAGLEMLIKEIQDKSGIINDILTKIQSTYAQLGDSCVGANLVSDEFLNNINKTRETIEANIDSYANDLRTLQQRLNENDKYLSTLFENATLEQATKNMSFDNKELIRDNKKTKD